MACLTNGEYFTWTINVSNNSVIPVTGVTTTVTLPAGVTYVSDVVTKGSYDDGTGVWTIGSLATGASATLTITVEVADALLQPFTASAVVAGNEFESYLLNNIGSSVKGGGCVDGCAGGFNCSDNTVGCLCGQVGILTGECGSGSTIDYRIVADSEVNCTVEIDPETGQYTVTPLNFSDPWSFEWEVYCCCDDVCTGPLVSCTQSGTVPNFTEAFLNEIEAFYYVNDETGGDVPAPYTEPLTIPAQVIDNIVVTEVFDDCIVFWTYTGGSWVEITRFCDTVGAGGVLTSLAYNPTTHSLLYTDENLAVTVINLDVGVITYNNITNVLSYTAEDGTVTNLSLNNVSVTNTIAGNRIATVTSENGTGVDIDETITTLVDNADKTFTYTSEDGTDTTFDATDVDTAFTNLVAGHLIGTYTNESGTTYDIDETITTVSNVIGGHRIATYTNENAAAVDIDETITSISHTGNGFIYDDENGDPTSVTYGVGSEDLCACTPTVDIGFISLELYVSNTDELTLTPSNLVNGGNLDIDWGDGTSDLGIVDGTPVVNAYADVGVDTWRVIAVTEPTGQAVTKIYVIQKADGTFTLADGTVVPSSDANAIITRPTVGTLDDRYCPTSDVLDLVDFGLHYEYNNTAAAVTGILDFRLETVNIASHYAYIADDTLTVTAFNAWPFKEGTKKFGMTLTHTNIRKFVEFHGIITVACAI